MSEHNPSAGDASQAGPDTQDSMTKRLPLIAHVLRNSGIKLVVANYRGTVCGLLFAGSTDAPVLPEDAVASTARDIARVLLEIATKRYPTALEDGNSTGRFEWNLAEDTLEHQHTITHRGL
jgi:hypothetical protein